MSSHPIPCISLDDIDESETVSTIRDACINIGFFYVENHSISDSLIAEVFSQSKLFFSLPFEQKKFVSDPILNRGYTAMEEETLDPKAQSKGDTKEGFYIGRDVPLDSADYDPRKLAGPNAWPTVKSCPHLNQHQCDQWKQVMLKYQQEASRVGYKLVQLIALAIGLKDRSFFNKSFTKPLETLRLLHYSNEKSDPEKGVYGCGAHSDYGMLTLLLTDENPGLQLLTKEGKWIDAPYRKGALIVNVGDMLERWTNGLFKSTVHRVLSSGKAERYSIPYFYDPNFDTEVRCLDNCFDDETNPPKYPPTTSGKHLLEKYLATYSDFMHSNVS